MRTIIMKVDARQDARIAADLGAPDGAVHGDLLVPADAEAPHGVARLGEHRRLARQRLEHL